MYIIVCAHSLLRNKVFKKNQQLEAWWQCGGALLCWIKVLGALIKRWNEGKAETSWRKWPGPRLSPQHPGNLDSQHSVRFLSEASHSPPGFVSFPYAAGFVRSFSLDITTCSHAKAKAQLLQKANKVLVVHHVALCTHVTYCSDLFILSALHNKDIMIQKWKLWHGDLWHTGSFLKLIHNKKQIWKLLWMSFSFYYSWMSWQSDSAQWERGKEGSILEAYLKSD